jgi:hypothetical protein
MKKSTLVVLVMAIFMVAVGSLFGQAEYSLGELEDGVLRADTQNNTVYIFEVYSQIEDEMVELNLTPISFSFLSSEDIHLYSPDTGTTWDIQFNDTTGKHTCNNVGLSAGNNVFGVRTDVVQYPIFGDLIQFEIESLDDIILSSGLVVGEFPLRGPIFTIVRPTLQIGLSAETPESSTLMAGQNNVELARFDLTALYGDLKLYEFPLHQYQLGYDGTINNIRAYFDSTLVAVADDFTGNWTMLENPGNGGGYFLNILDQDMKPLSIVGDINLNASGQIVGIEVNSGSNFYVKDQNNIALSEDQILGVYPVRGNPMDIVEYLTPPEIDVLVHTITDSSFAVSVNANEACTYQLVVDDGNGYPAWYGTIGYSDSTEFNVYGLLSGETHYCTLTSTNQNENSTESGFGVTTTGDPDTTPPEIIDYGVVFNENDYSTVSIYWEANEPCRYWCIVRNQNGGIIYNILNPAHNESDGFELNELPPGETYTYELTLRDLSGNETIMEDSFTTLEDTFPPIISNVSDSLVTSRSYMMTCETDEYTNMKMFLDLDTTYVEINEYFIGYSPIYYAKDHVFDTYPYHNGNQRLLLDSATTYNYYLEATDEAGNVTIDDNNGNYYQFTTLNEGEINDDYPLTEVRVTNRNFWHEGDKYLLLGQKGDVNIILQEIHWNSPEYIIMGAHNYIGCYNKPDSIWVTYNQELEVNGSIVTPDWERGRSKIPEWASEFDDLSIPEMERGGPLAEMLWTKDCFPGVTNVRLMNLQFFNDSETVIELRSFDESLIDYEGIQERRSLYGSQLFITNDGSRGNISEGGEDVDEYDLYLLGQHLVISNHVNLTGTMYNPQGEINLSRGILSGLSQATIIDYWILNASLQGYDYGYQVGEPFTYNPTQLSFVSNQEGNNLTIETEGNTVLVSGWVNDEPWSAFGIQTERGIQYFSNIENLDIEVPQIIQSQNRNLFEFELPEGLEELQIEAVNTNLTSVSADPEQIPGAKTQLLGNFPNPFNPSTTIQFSTAKKGNTELAIFNIKGQKVTTLVDGQIDAGSHTVTWNGTDQNNNAVSSGVYFYKLTSDSYSEVKKMILTK